VRSASPSSKDPELTNPGRDDIQKQRTPHSVNFAPKYTPKRGAANPPQQNKVDSRKGK